MTSRSLDEDLDPEIVPLTREQALQLSERQPSVSPWWVVLAQVAVGLLAAGFSWLLTKSDSVAWSVLYGAMAAALPAALFARGLRGRLSRINPGAAVLGFFVWEMVKLVLTLAILVAAPRLVVGLSWPGLLVGLVLALKMYWFALLWVRRSVKLKGE
ncbi:MAG: ATP synthase subunit I [Hylemonella sp.]|nr:ATP synthase subunit I [Hylemonella sp.]